MAMDLLKYNELLEDFIVRMESLPRWDEGKVREILTPICHFLGICRLKLEVYDNPAAEAMHNGRSFVLVDEGEPGEERPHVSREMNGAGNVVLYSLYHAPDAGDWDDEDEKHLRAFQKVLYTFHGRLRLFELVEERTYIDPQLHTRNMAFVLRLCGQLIAKKEICEYGLCYFNLKGFALVNARVGRNMGTQIMTEFANELTCKLSEPGVVGRIGGDNFLCLFKKSELETVRGHLQGSAVVYNKNSGERVQVRAVAGYFLPEEKDEIHSPDEMMDRVSMSFNVAKHMQDSDEVFYSLELQERQTEQKSIERQFPDAIRNGEFKVYYQPKVSLNGYKLAGAEALCRWIKEGVVVPPGAFIPVLEQSMNVCVLDFYMLERVCEDIRRWLDCGRKPVRVSVNFSRRHLGDMDLVKHIMDIVDRHKVPHEYIEVELTETTTDVEFEDLKRVVNSLQDQGIHTSVDDFGTGYSSLNLIREISWNVLKLDKSFLPVMAGGEKTNESIMLKHVISMAHDMGLECIVEGVETREQVELLLKNNCYLAQGFYFDRPLPVHEFEQRLDKQEEVYCEGGKTRV